MSAKMKPEPQTVMQGDTTQPAPAASDGVKLAPVVALGPKLAPTFAVKLADLTLREERTKLVRLPDVLHLEGNPSTVKKPRGHQVDPSRPASCVAVMPCLKKLEATGNPYPAEPDETVVTDDKWRPYVVLAHHAYALLVERGEVHARAADVVAEALRRAGLPETTAYAGEAVSDALRDLAMVGLAAQLALGRARWFRLPAA